MKNKQTLSAKEKMLRGSAWMTAASIFSRILGAIYIIPWYAWFGEHRLQANALYAKGYTVYAVFLMLSTAGIPSAVAKQVAHYNSLNEYEIGRRLYRKSFVIMLLLGIIMGGILWGAAPVLAAGDMRTVPVFRSLATALAIIPLMSLTRGFFQGYQDMAPSALSQLVEQVIRVFYMLVTAFIIMKVINGSYQTGVVQSTFAAFVGAVGGILTLAYCYLRKKGEFDYLRANSSNSLEVSDGQLIKELLAQSLPFIFIGIATNLYNLIDQYTFPWVMSKVSTYSSNYIDEMYALFAANANKLIMIVVSLATALAATAIPLLIEFVTKGQKRDAKKQLGDSLELFFFIMLPSALGMAAVARPLYIVFYGYSAYGIAVLKIAAYTAITQGLLIVLASLLQGLYENKRAVAYAIFGLIVKLVVQFPLTAKLEAFGPLVASGIGMSCSIYLMLRYLRRSYGMNFKRVQHTFNALMILSLAMFVVVVSLNFLWTTLFDSESRIVAILELIVTAGSGGYVYVYLTLKTHMADKILGPRVARLRQLLRIR
ncbi:putative polysaccharide biosynthesis protein [Ligilactobacillus agilis]|uniref:putative polysaccharide biosynthesis protein n=1 Tax=Ligilactobacillus agilis TaxID=1601 RepID=UPI00265CA649|nr:polysaccharide biosynthesis protein [Ligilactobacillus agilis]